MYWKLASLYYFFIYFSLKDMVANFGGILGAAIVIKQ